MLTEIELVEKLTRMIDENSQKEVADKLGVSPQYLNDIINYRRTIGKKVYSALQLRKVVYFEPIDPDQNYVRRVEK